MRRLPLIAILTLAAACAALRPPPRPPLLPLSPSWKTLLGEFVRPPLAADGRRVFVATRDGAVRALDPATGEVSWKAEGVPGTLAAADGVVLVRDVDGTVRSLHPRTGAVRWTAQTDLPGDLPPVIDEDRALVAGPGLAAIDTATGRILWTERSGAGITAPPLRVGARILTGEKDGTLRCRDRATGAPSWSVPTGRALAAAPVVDAQRKKVYLGTTDRRIQEIDLDDGSVGWRWKVGADVVDQGLLLPGHVQGKRWVGGRILFASYDAVLYSVRLGGNLDWRAGLPSRPLSGPMLVNGYVVVACLENEIVVVTPEDGRRVGAFKTPAEIRTPPLVFENRIVVGLRDRSVLAYLPASAGVPAPASAPPSDAPPAPTTTAPDKPPAAPAPSPGSAPVDAPPPGR